MTTIMCRSIKKVKGKLLIPNKKKHCTKKTVSVNIDGNHAETFQHGFSAVSVAE